MPIFIVVIIVTDYYDYNYYSSNYGAPYRGYGYVPLMFGGGGGGGTSLGEWEHNNK